MDDHGIADLRADDRTQDTEPLGLRLQTRESRVRVLDVADLLGAELLVIDGMGHDLPRAVWPVLVERISALIARA